MYFRWLNIEEFFPLFDLWFLIATVHLWRGGQLTVPTSQRSLTCCKFSMFLGMNKESSHSGKEPEPYSLNIAIVAGSEVVEQIGLPVEGQKAVDDGGMSVLAVGMDRAGWVFDGVLAIGMDRPGWVYLHKNKVESQERDRLFLLSTNMVAMMPHEN